MAIRPIDGNVLIEWFRPYLHTGEAIPADVVIEDIRSMPTLTQPNESLTCEGCACEEYRRDTYPCNCCTRNDETISDQYRPPEGEEDCWELRVRKEEKHPHERTAH